MNSLRAGIGPRFELSVGSAQPFLHLLGGLRYDNPEWLGVTDGPHGSSEAEPYTAFGGMAGVGVDIALGSSVFLWLGADLQIFYHDEDYMETVRLAAGIAF